MMNLKFILGATAAAVTLASAADAATVRITEGQRPQVVGTTAVNDPGPTAIRLGNLEAGQTKDVYGQLFGGSDLFRFTSDVEFMVDFIFGGFDFEDGTPGDGPSNNPVSGQRQDAPTTPGEPDKMVRYELLRSVDGVRTPVAEDIITGDVTGGTGESSSIFDGQTFGPGTYRFNVFGQGTPRGVEYDVRIAEAIAPIPLPASALLLLAGLGGLGVAARRKKA